MTHNSILQGRRQRVQAPVKNLFVPLQQGRTL
jgi:hypothetical protein